MVVSDAVLKYKLVRIASYEDKAQSNQELTAVITSDDVQLQPCSLELKSKIKTTVKI